MDELEFSPVHARQWPTTHSTRTMSTSSSTIMTIGWTTTTDARYERMLEDGRCVVVVLEWDGVTVVTAWEDKRRRRRSTRRR